MKFKKFKNLKTIAAYKKKENFLKLSKFLFIYLLNLLQVKKFDKDQKVKLYTLRKQFLFLNQLIQKKNSKTKIYRNCIINNRSRGVFRPYGLSRCVLKELITFGRLPGYTKSIW